MKANRHWEERNGCYELHFESYGNDEVVLKFTPDKKDNTCYWYVSKDLNVEADYEFCESMEDAKETFEIMYEQHLEGQLGYYEELLEQWNEDGESDG